MPNVRVRSRSSWGSEESEARRSGGCILETIDLKQFDAGAGGSSSRCSTIDSLGTLRRPLVVGLLTPRKLWGAGGGNAREYLSPLSASGVSLTVLDELAGELQNLDYATKINHMQLVEAAGRDGVQDQGSGKRSRPPERRLYGRKSLATR